DVEQVIGELEGDTEPLTIAAHDVDRSRRAAAEHRAVAPRRRDERTGLVGQDAKVVVDRVDAAGRRTVVTDLPRTQSHERLRLDPDSLRPQPCDELGGLAEEQ